jgi:hypothetical protein
MWSLRIQNPEIQAKYRNYQRETVRDKYKLLVATFALFATISLCFFTYAKIKKPIFGTNSTEIKMYYQKVQATFENLIISFGCMGIVIASLLLSKRWLLITEFIYPILLVYVCLIIVILPGNFKLFRGEPSGIIRQISQLWIIIIWGSKPIFLRTDYKTSLWKLPLLCGLYALSAFGVNGHVNTPTLYRVLWGLGYIVGIELYGY